MAKKNSELDRLSTLPDSILTCNILCHLSLRDVVRTSILSSTWHSLWKQIPHLDFSDEFVDSIKLRQGRGSRWKYLEQKVKYINDIIYNIRLLHSVHIERLSIDVHSSDIMELQPNSGLDVEQWIRLAALKEVKHLALKISAEEIYIPPSLFTCHGLRNLAIESLRFTGIPTEFNGFQHLQSCCVSDVDGLSEDEVKLKQFIGLCPLLHKLELKYCSLHSVNIQAPNLNSLKILSCCNMASLTLDCPQLVELEIFDCDRLIELPMLNSLRKLSLKGITLRTTLGCFHNLKEVHIEALFAWLIKNSIWQIFEDQYFEQESAIGDMVPSLTSGEVVADSAFPRLKKAHVHISSSMKKEEAIMLASILSNAPSLNTITVTLPYCHENIHDKEFIDKVLDLQQLYEKVDIIMEKHEWKQDATCMETYGNYDSSDYLENDLSGSDHDDDEEHDYEWYHSR